jgi:hypothetical protein
MHSRVGIHSQMVDRVAALEEYVNGVQGCLSLKEVGIISNLGCSHLDPAMWRGRGRTTTYGLRWAAMDVGCMGCVGCCLCGLRAAGCRLLTKQIGVS